MYRVLIVDDESFVIKSLIATIDWNDYGFEVIGQAGNGLEALEAIRTLKPDLVFTDVQMPGMGGLELIKTAGESGTGALFVVISGYAEFAYAQKAMNYGALGYCLKPFEDSEIAGILVKAASKLDQNKAAVELKLMDYLEDNSDAGRRIVRHALESLGIPCGEECRILVLVALGGGPLRFPSPVQPVNLRIGSNKNAYLADFRHEGLIKRHLAEHYPQGALGIGLNAEPCSVEGIKPAIEASIAAANQFFITGTAGVYETGVLNPGGMNRHLKQLDQAIDAKDTVQVLKQIELMGRSKGVFDIRCALSVYNMVMSYLFRSDTAHYENYAYTYEKLTNLFRDFEHMLEELQLLLVRQTNAVAAAIPKGVRNETFHGILQYVDEHYCSDISIQSISQQFNIHPNYVSQLFKKSLDTTFTDYVARKRIAYAGNLLKTTNLPINEIAHRAGYDEYYYFTRVFKKVTGKTPTEYRDQS